jgi:hypothetical protein
MVLVQKVSVSFTTFLLSTPEVPLSNLNRFKINKFAYEIKLYKIG